LFSARGSFFFTILYKALRIPFRITQFVFTVYRKINKDQEK
jgi:hypothetical protein